MKKDSNLKWLFIILYMIIPVVWTYFAVSEMNYYSTPIKILIVLFVICCTLLFYYFVFLSKHKNSEWFYYYVVDYDTLIAFMNDEEAIANENHETYGKPIGFMFNGDYHNLNTFYNKNSNDPNEQQLGTTYSWDLDPVESLELLLKNEVFRANRYVLIKVERPDSKILDQFKNNHPEISIDDYV